MKKEKASNELSTRPMVVHLVEVPLVPKGREIEGDTVSSNNGDEEERKIRGELQSTSFKLGLGP